jgi:hypothetical protein
MSNKRDFSYFYFTGESIPRLIWCSCPVIKNTPSGFLVWGDGGVGRGDGVTGGRQGCTRDSSNHRSNAFYHDSSRLEASL